MATENDFEAVDIPGYTYPLEQSYLDFDYYKDQNNELRHRLNRVKALFVVFFTSCLAAVTACVVPLMFENQDLKKEVEMTHDLPVHSVPDFNARAEATLSAYRSDKSLPSASDVPNEYKDIIAMWQGCALNKYANKAWEKEDCAELAEYGEGFTTKFEEFSFEDKPFDTKVFIDKVDELNTQSKINAKNKAPAVLEKDAQHIMVFAVGKGDDEPWKVYTFMVKKS